MQDSAKLLGFNAKRQLNFNSSRALSIPIGRALQFDLNRELGFDSTRNLPFGRRGVMFRGYVCPVCGAAVLLESEKCDECGVVFASAPSEPVQPPKEQGRPTSEKGKDWRSPKYEATQTTARRQTPQAPAARASPRAPATQPPSRKAEVVQRKPGYQPAAQSRPAAPQAPSQKPRTFQCPVCNAAVPVGSATCPRCTIQFSLKTPPPPEDALVMCPICDLKVASKTDYCTRCGEPLSPGAISRHKRELESMRRNRMQAEQSGEGRVGEPQAREPASHTITWEEYLEKKKKGGGNR